MTNNFDTFEDVKHLPLRAFNRLAMAHNIKEDSGEGSMRDYLSLFSDKERASILIISSSIKSLGLDKVRAAVLRGIGKDLVDE